MARLARAWDRWLWREVALPLLATRAGLILVGYLSHFLIADTRYLYGARPTTPYTILNMLSGWDSEWYLKIVRDGYSMQGDVWSVTSSIAFFPLYPLLVRAIVWFLPGAGGNEAALVAIGIVLSNTCLFVALALLYRLAEDLLSRPGAPRRVILYALAYPAGFFFSCFYTESLFFMLSVGAFYAAHHRRWALAGLAGFLAALARPVGALLALPLAWLYLGSTEQRGATPRRWVDLAWLLLPPTGLLAYLLAVLPLTAICWRRSRSRRPGAKPWPCPGRALPTRG